MCDREFDISAATSEEERPACRANTESSGDARAVNTASFEETMQKEEQSHRLKREQERDHFGQRVMIAILIAFVYMVIGESILLALGKPIPGTLEMTVDLFKFVVTTIMGYIFGKASSR
jgi:hypothetical protein